MEKRKGLRIDHNGTATIVGVLEDVDVGKLAILNDGGHLDIAVKGVGNGTGIGAISIAAEILSWDGPACACWTTARQSGGDRLIRGNDVGGSGCGIGDRTDSAEPRIVLACPLVFSSGR